MVRWIGAVYGVEMRKVCSGLPLGHLDSRGDLPRDSKVVFHELRLLTDSLKRARFVVIAWIVRFPSSFHSNIITKKNFFVLF